MNLFSSISVEGSAFDTALKGKDFLGTPCCIKLLAAVRAGRVGVVGVLNPRKWGRGRSIERRRWDGGVEGSRKCWRWLGC